jgi:transcriptional regulator with XRE-family HTH domain
MQTSINTVIAITLEAIRETDGVKASQFCKMLNMSPGNWSKVKSGKSSISIESLYRYTRVRSSNLHNFFEVIERLISGATGQSVSEPEPYIFVKSENLVKQGKWDCLIEPDFFYVTVRELIKAKYSKSSGPLSLWNMQDDDELFETQGSIKYAGQDELTGVYKFIDNLNWHIDGFNTQWIYKAKDKIEHNLRVLAKTRAEIKKVRKTDQNFANLLDKTLKELMTKKIRTEGKEGVFHGSEAYYYIEDVKEKILHTKNK